MNVLELLVRWFFCFVFSTVYIVCCKSWLFLLRHRMYNTDRSRTPKSMSRIVGNIKDFCITVQSFSPSSQLLHWVFTNDWEVHVRQFCRNNLYLYCVEHVHFIHKTFYLSLLVNWSGTNVWKKLKNKRWQGWKVWIMVVNSRIGSIEYTERNGNTLRLEGLDSLRFPSHYKKKKTSLALQGLLGLKWTSYKFFLIYSFYNS